VALVPLIPGGWATFATVALLVTLAPPYSIFRSRGSGRYAGRWNRLLVLRPYWYLILSLLLLGPLALAGAAVGGLGWGRPVSGEQIALMAGGVFLAIMFLIGYIDSRRLTTRHLAVTLPELPTEFDGFRIAQISDLHVGPQTSSRFLGEVARRVREAEADIIVVTGDLVDDFAPDAELYAAALGDLAAPEGVYVIPGNHDIYAGWPEVRERLERLPLTVLVNDARILKRGSAALAVLGTGDPAARGGTAEGAPEIRLALEKVPDGICTVALAHNPALWPPLAHAGVELTLSGHTHYGQFALPRLGWSLATPFLRHSMGVYREGRSWLYINPGTNYWGIPFRLGTPPEVTVVELRKTE